MPSFGHYGCSNARTDHHHPGSLKREGSGTNRSDDSYDGDGDGNGGRGRTVSIHGLSGLGSGNEDDALHNRVANEERRNNANGKYV